MVPGGCARAALHVPRGGAGPFGARAQSSGFSPWWPRGGASRAGGESRAISGDWRYLPQRPATFPLPKLRLMVCPPSSSQTLCRAGWETSVLPAAATVSLPGARRTGEIAPPHTPPILLATLEAVNRSLWGILLNFSNQVSSDLMPSV